MENKIQNILNVANKIAETSRRGNANYMICNQYVANAIFEMDKVKSRKAKIKRLLENVKRNKS